MTLEHILKFLSMFLMAPVSAVPENHADNTVIVRFVTDPEEINQLCGPPPPGYIIMACVDKIGGHVMTVPNPCVYKDHDAYARLLCHELGHTNGWRHGDK
jgi:hypothetical protein